MAQTRPLWEADGPGAGQNSTGPGSQDQDPKCNGECDGFRERLMGSCWQVKMVTVEIVLGMAGNMGDGEAQGKESVVSPDGRLGGFAVH